MSNTLMNQVAGTKDNTSTEGNSHVNYERMLRYNKIVKEGYMSRSYIEDGTKMRLSWYSIEDIDWDIALEQLRSQDYPLRELEIEWGYNMDRSIEASFIELTNIIRNHKTLIKLICSIQKYSPETKTAMFLEALNENRSIESISFNCDKFDSATARVFGQTLMNNQTWHTLSMSVYSSAAPRFGDPEAIEVGTLIEFAPALRTTALQRLTVGQFQNEDFKVLIEYLPKTLVYLYFAWSVLKEDSVPLLSSYLKSNNCTLKKLILNTYYIESSLKKQGLLSLPNIKVLKSDSWKVEILNNKVSYDLNTDLMSDNDWSELFTELRKDDTMCREVYLSRSSEINQNHLNYIKLLLDNQFRLTTLRIANYFSDPWIYTQFLQYLKENNSISRLELHFPMNSNAFNQLMDLLKNKNNIIYLNLTDNSCISDEQAITLAQILKTNTILETLVLIDTTISDVGFQALLSSLPNSLLQLVVNNSRISAQSLPALLDFITTHPHLKHVSLRKNGISETNPDNINVPDLVEKIFQITNANQCLFDFVINKVVQETMINLTDDYITFYLAHLRDDHIFELCNEIKKMSNRSLKLHLACNDQISYIGYGYLANMLSSTSTIVTLNVANSKMSEEACTSLLKDLWKNQILQQFSISSNRLNIQHIEYIGRFIQNNSMLKGIDLGGCEIDDNGVASFAKFLAESNLEKLDLSSNLISDRGCTTLLSSIPLTLTELLLGQNQITKSSLKTIQTFLKNNRTLRKLTLSDNAIWERLNQASKHNKICELD